jgi:hypothetical protein
VTIAPTEIAPGYAVEAELSPGAVRCVDPDGRRWVLKPLPADCRHGGGLHPAIRDRLAHVRDLPHPRVATLLGVVRGTDPDAAFLVWQHVEGRPIDAVTPTVPQLITLARSLATAVELLHARGLVHGALTAGNVIVDRAGDVWLTHLSPYLWDDPADDVRAVVELLRPMAAALSLAPPMVDEPPSPSALRDLANRWEPTTETPPADVPRHRRRSAVAAVAVAAVAVGVAVAVWEATGRSASSNAGNVVLPLVGPGR